MTRKRSSGYRGTAVLLFVLALLSSSGVAGVRPFLQESLKEITAARSGQPFLLILWSVDCPPCMKELAHLQQLRERFAPASLVLISTDEAEAHESVDRILVEFGLDRFDNWAFADGFPERLRYQVDPDWFGELPRSYFYDAGHRRTATSGALTIEQLHQWLDTSRKFYSSE